MLTFVAPVGGVTAGTAYKIGDTIVVANTTVAAGAQFEGDTEGVFALAKAASVTPAPGAKLYLTSSNTVTDSASGNTLIGIHASPVAAGSSDATIRVRLGIVA